MNPGAWSIMRFGFAAFGVLILYARWGKNALRIYVPRDVVQTFHLSADSNTRLEFVIFLVLGSVIAVLFADPQSPQQAISAGLGWTGLIAAPSRSKSASQSKKEVERE